MTNLEIKDTVRTFALENFDLNFNEDGLPEDAVVRNMGDELLCNSEELADFIADEIEMFFNVQCNTGYYDPEEDARNNEVDDRTGWWYVTY